MSTYSATVLRIDDERGVRAVVTEADDVIHVAPELLSYAADPGRWRIPGDIEIDGDRISFGTPDEGLGRLTYRHIGWNDNGWVIYKRNATGTCANEREG